MGTDLALTHPCFYADSAVTAPITTRGTARIHMNEALARVCHNRRAYWTSHHRDKPGFVAPGIQVQFGSGPKGEF